MRVSVLAINGSSKKNGRTARLLNSVLGHFGDGVSVELVHLSDKRIESCKSYCAEQGTSCQFPCSIDDDMKELVEKIKKADCIVLASPVYWYSMSGIMKNFIDRLTVCDMVEPPLFDGKVFATVAAALLDGAAGVTMQLSAPLISMGGLMVPYNDVFVNGSNVWRSELGVEPEKRLAKNLVKMAMVLKQEQGNWFEKC